VNGDKATVKQLHAEIRKGEEECMEKVTLMAVGDTGPLTEPPEKMLRDL
jgi:hypothetical protein